MTGTGFLGYAKCGEKYCTVLVTNNHVIENFGDAMGSRFIFENVLPDRHVILKGADIFVKNSFWCSPLKEVTMYMEILHTIVLTNSVIINHVCVICVPYNRKCFWEKTFQKL